MTPSSSRERKPQLPSLLPVWLKRLLTAALALAGFMLADTVFLVLVRLADNVALAPFALGATSLPGFYQVMLLAHTAVGLLLAAVMLVFLVAHLPSVWRRFHSEAAWTGIPYAALGVALVVSGLFILSAAASRENSWAWWAHVASGALVVGLYIGHRIVSYTRPEGRRFARFLGSVAAGGLAMFMLHGGLAMSSGRGTVASDGPGGPERDVASMLAGRFGSSGWVPVGAVPPESPFFPSAATTTTGAYLAARILTEPGFGTPPEVVRAEVEARGFASDALIGAEACVACHPDVVDQWASSAHRFASFNNPFYEATIMGLRENSLESNAWVDEHAAALGEEIDGVGKAKSKWCSGCHDPALMLAGDMGRDFDRNTLEAQAGLTCLACHAMDQIHDRTGNGNYNIADEQEDPYLFADAAPGSVARYLHDVALKARPTVHQAQLIKPFFQESAYCATCHKVSLSEPVNNYRWLRGQNEFDNWDDSGVSLNAARTFYLPPARRLCQDCHMPPEPAPLGDVAAENGLVRSHRFAAANTALPFIRGDTAMLRRIEDFLQAEKLSVDLFAVRVPGVEGALPLAETGTVVPVGVPLTFDVVIRNRGVGHTFPGGTNDSNEGWLEFTIEDAEGSRLVASGLLGADGHLDPMAHTFKAVIVDRNGDPVDERNAQDIHVTVYQNVIGPGSADLAHYEVALPPAFAGSTLTVSARLLWRKFNRGYSEFAFAANPAGFKQFFEAPELPVTEIASDSVVIEARADESRGAGAAELTADEWARYNDYGIALLQEGDTRAAASAFSRVEVLQPDRLDGPLNRARVALTEGNLVEAYDALERAEVIQSGNAQVAWLWGQVLLEDGRYKEAVLAYRRVLEDFPEDRGSWRALGRTLYLDQQFDEALVALGEVLAIDPEDRIAHYHRMLSLRALGREEEAGRAEAAYLYYGIDESAQELTRAYRTKDAGANIMAQPVPIHRLQINR